MRGRLSRVGALKTWLGVHLVRLGARLIGVVPGETPDARLYDDEDDGPAPADRSVVKIGPEAARMIQEGREFARDAFERREAAEPPLRGSARERMMRARRGTGAR